MDLGPTWHPVPPLHGKQMEKPWNEEIVNPYSKYYDLISEKSEAILYSNDN